MLPLAVTTFVLTGHYYHLTFVLDLHPSVPGVASTLLMHVNSSGPETPGAPHAEGRCNGLVARFPLIAQDFNLL